MYSIHMRFLNLKNGNLASFNINSSEMYCDFCCMSFLTFTFLLFQDFKVKTAMKMSMIVLETCARMVVPVWMGSTGIHVNVH